MGGYVYARHNIGAMEGRAGNVDRALRHFMIAVRDGDSHSLKKIQEMYGYGFATKDMYDEALQYYQSYLDEVKNDQRDEAAEAYDQKYC